MGSQIKVEICGKNNELISEADFTIINEAEVQENLRKLICHNKEKITEKILLKMDKKGIINTAIGSSKKNEEKPLWIPNYKGASYFGSVVGVIESGLTLSLDDEELEVPGDMRLSETVGKINLEIRLQIKSRFDAEKPYFLATMLFRDKIKLNDNMVLSSEDDLYDYMLLFWYKTKLQDAYAKGFYKTYRRFEANNERLKGAIDISRHIRLNTGQNNGKIAYSYRENTINNFLNHLIVAAYEYLKKKYPELIEQNFDNDLELKGIIEGIRCEIGYNPLESKALIKMNNKPIAHPYFMEYEDLRVICIKILRDEGVSLWDAEDESVKSILFYIPDLWELYLEDKLKKKIGKDIYTQGKTPDGDKAIRIFGNMTALRNSDFVQSTYPDFVFFDEKTPYLVLDAKFRKGWEASIAKEKKDGTIFDLDDYDKCIRDMNSVQVCATGVIYPTNTLPEKYPQYFEEDSISHSISQYNKQDVFYTFPVVVPSANAERRYTEWKKEFDSCIEMTLEKIVEKVELEKDYAVKLRKYMQNFPKRQAVKNNDRKE